MRSTPLQNFSFSKLGLLIILGVGWMEKVFVREGVPESIYKLVETNVPTSWLTYLGPLGPNYFLGYFELVLFLLLIFKEKFGAPLACLIFLTTLSFLFNGFSFSIVKDVTMLGISIDLTLKNWINKDK